jgi:hypothetical protein
MDWTVDWKKMEVCSSAASFKIIPNKEQGCVDLKSIKMLDVLSDKNLTDLSDLFWILREATTAVVNATTKAAQIARQEGCDASTVKKWAKDNNILKIEGKYRFMPDDITAFKERDKPGRRWS